MRIVASFHPAGALIATRIYGQVFRSRAIIFYYFVLSCVRGTDKVFSTKLPYPPKVKLLNGIMRRNVTVGGRAKRKPSLRSRKRNFRDLFVNKSTRYEARYIHVDWLGSAESETKLKEKVRLKKARVGSVSRPISDRFPLSDSGNARSLCSVCGYFGFVTTKIFISGSKCFYIKNGRFEIYRFWELFCLYRNNPIGDFRYFSILTLKIIVYVIKFTFFFRMSEIKNWVYIHKIRPGNNIL